MLVPAAAKMAKERKAASGSNQTKLFAGKFYT